MRLHQCLFFPGPLGQHGRLSLCVASLATVTSRQETLAVLRLREEVTVRRFWLLGLVKPVRAPPARRFMIVDTVETVSAPLLPIHSSLMMRIDSSRRPRCDSRRNIFHVSNRLNV